MKGEITKIEISEYYPRQLKLTIVITAPEEPFRPSFEEIEAVAGKEAREKAEAEYNKKYEEYKKALEEFYSFHIGECEVTQ